MPTSLYISRYLERPLLVAVCSAWIVLGCASRDSHPFAARSTALALIAQNAGTTVGGEELSSEATAGGERPLIAEEPAAEAVPDAESLRVLEPSVDLDAAPKIKRWQTALRRCGTYRGRRYCNGPRRVPMPFGAAKARAERLHLGTKATAGRLLSERPRQSWIDETRALFLKQPDRARQWPVEEGRYVRGYGYTRSGARNKNILHKGIDLAANKGTRVRSIADGLVAYADNDLRGYGNLLIVVHSDGSVSSYAHLSRIYYFAGQTVRGGQVVGEVGSNLSQGPHLHMELRKAGRLLNPMKYFSEDDRERVRTDEAWRRQTTRILIVAADRFFGMPRLAVGF
ncbi:MAG: M23 family metallopeptidase [Polyangiales bacterium]